MIIGIKWINIFKNGPSINLLKIAFKTLGRPYHFKFFKGCLPQILLGPFLNTLTQIKAHTSFKTEP